MRRFHAIPALLALAVGSLGTGSFLARPAMAAENTVIVQPGDTLTAIAALHGVSVEALAALNGLADPNRILAGQQLRIASPDPAPPAGAPGQPGVHVVSPGETLTAISIRYGVTLPALVAANELSDPNRILPGQRLQLPSTPEAQPIALDWVGRAVLPGEHLTAIAAERGTTVEELARVNGLADPSLIFAGTTILVPGPAAPLAAATAAPAASILATPAGPAAPAAASPEPAAAPAAPAAPPQAAAGAPTALPAAGTPAAAEQPAAPAPSAPMPEWMATLAAGREDVRQLIARHAAEMGVPASFALAVAWQESGWQQSVVSGAGAVGVMQLLPDTGAWVAEVMLREPVDVWSTESNVRAGVRLLRHYLDRYAGDRQLALAAYFQGQYALDQFGIYNESVPYIESILFHERFFGG